MKLFFILAFVFVACYAAPSSKSDAFDHLNTVNNHIHGLVFNHPMHLSSPIFEHGIQRSKRHVSWRDLDTDSDEEEDARSCILTCTYQLQQAALRLKSQLGTTSISSLRSPADFNSRFNTLKESCNRLRPSIQCFQRCPSSELQKTMMKALDPLKYICVDRFQDILDNSRCMMKLESEIKTRCIPRCRRFEAAMNQTAELGERPYLAALYTLAELQEMLSGTCNYISCFTDCDAPLTRSACGETAATLKKDFIQKMFGALNSYDQVRTGGIAMPNECKRLGQTEQNPEPEDAEIPSELD